MQTDKQTHPKHLKYVLKLGFTLQVLLSFATINESGSRLLVALTKVKGFVLKSPSQSHLFQNAYKNSFYLSYVHSARFVKFYSYYDRLPVSFTSYQSILSRHLISHLHCGRNEAFFFINILKYVQFCFLPLLLLSALLFIVKSCHFSLFHFSKAIIL